MSLAYRTSFVHSGFARLAEPGRAFYQDLYCSSTSVSTGNSMERAPASSVVKFAARLFMKSSAGELFPAWPITQLDEFLSLPLRLAGQISAADAPLRGPIPGSSIERYRP